MDGSESVTFKLPSKLDAIKTDNAMMGHNVTKIEVEANVTVKDMLKAITNQTAGLPTDLEKQQLRDMKQAEKIDENSG